MASRYDPAARDLSVEAAQEAEMVALYEDHPEGFTMIELVRLGYERAQARNDALMKRGLNLQASKEGRRTRYRLGSPTWVEPTVKGFGLTTRWIVGDPLYCQLHQDIAGPVPESVLTALEGKIAAMVTARLSPYMGTASVEPEPEGWTWSFEDYAPPVTEDDGQDPEPPACDPDRDLSTLEDVLWEE